MRFGGTSPLRVAARRHHDRNIETYFNTPASRLPTLAPPDFDTNCVSTGTALLTISGLRPSLLNAWPAEARPAADPAIFDAALEQRVRALQAAYGIRDDGIVGPETQFALSALDDSGPHLARTLQ